MLLIGVWTLVLLGEVKFSLKSINHIHLVRSTPSCDDVDEHYIFSLPLWQESCSACEGGAWKHCCAQQSWQDLVCGGVCRKRHMHGGQWWILESFRDHASSGKEGLPGFETHERMYETGSQWQPEGCGVDPTWLQAERPHSVWHHWPQAPKWVWYSDHFNYSTWSFPEERELFVSGSRVNQVSWATSTAASRYFLWSLNVVLFD